MGRLFNLGDKRFTYLDWDELTLAEQIDVQKMTGLKGSALIDSVVGGDYAVAAAVLTVSLRRDDPSVSYDEVASHKQSDFTLVTDEAGDAVDPTRVPEAVGASGGDTSADSPRATATT